MPPGGSALTLTRSCLRAEIPLTRRRRRPSARSGGSLLGAGSLLSSAPGGRGPSGPQQVDGEQGQPGPAGGDGGALQQATELDQRFCLGVEGDAGQDGPGQEGDAAGR